MEILSKYFGHLQPLQLRRFQMLEPLYREWNERVNVISRKDIDNFYERHVLHSLAIAKVTSFTPGTRILDVGTGGGFPGIPLAIMFPHAKFHLVDSIGKKIRVVDAISGELGLENTSSEKARVEDLHESYDFIVSRAVTTLPKFEEWVGKLISKTGRNDIPNGILYLKGGDFSDEISGLKRKSSIYQLSAFFEEEFFQTKALIHIAK